MDVFTYAGIFIFPLALCSFAAVFITFERLIALRSARIVPLPLVESFAAGSIEDISMDAKSVAGRIIAFYKSQQNNRNSLKAYADLEISRMERGIFLLEVIIGVAPLLGLLGTVTGLTQVFSGFSAETGLPNPSTFITGIAVALNTTILGLAIAIPTLASHAFLLRKVESQALCICLGVQSILDSKKA